MARQRKDKEKPIKLRQPDRSGPTEATLLDLAGQRNLFEQAARREKELRREGTGSGGGGGDGEDDDEDDDDDAVLSVGAERVLETLLWTATMAVLHFTLDVLVQNQYGVQIKWGDITLRTVIAWFGKDSPPSSLPLPLRKPAPSLDHVDSHFH
jgi:hypothetical protein